MGSLATPFESLPLGFRFRPTDIELIDHYLRLKINGKQGEVACIREVDICRVEPWDLPGKSFFFIDFDFFLVLYLCFAFSSNLVNSGLILVGIQVMLRV